MRKQDLHLDRRQSWCVSTDPEFSRKTSEIVGLYLNPPENAIVLSVDEKPSIQALERAQGYIRLEQDHRAIKRRVRASQYFRSFWGAWRTIAGYEAIHMI